MNINKKESGYYITLLFVFLILINGCANKNSDSNNNIDINNQESTEPNSEIAYRTAQANSFTVNQPYSWSRQFIGLPEGAEDISSIPQGLSENDIYMVITSPSEEQTIPTTKILFAVNNLSFSKSF